MALVKRTELLMKKQEIYAADMLTKNMQKAKNNALLKGMSNQARKDNGVASRSATKQATQVISVVYISQIADIITIKRLTQHTPMLIPHAKKNNAIKSFWTKGEKVMSFITVLCIDNL